MANGRILRSIPIAIFAALLAIGWLGTIQAQQREPGLAIVVQVKGVVNSAKTRIITRTLREASDRSAQLVILEIDSSGGLLEPTNQVMEALLESQTPTVLYVSPQGAQAGPAGTLMAAAADFTAMAPGSTIGSAASPRDSAPPAPARKT